jgi:hypothetical protein
MNTKEAVEGLVEALQADRGEPTDPESTAAPADNQPTEDFLAVRAPHSKRDRDIVHEYQRAIRNSRHKLRELHVASVRVRRAEDAMILAGIIEPQTEAGRERQRAVLELHAEGKIKVFDPKG